MTFQLFLALRAIEGILWLTFFALLAWRLAVGASAARRRRDGAVGALERRFVAGEVPEAEFRRIKAVLGE